MNDQPTALELKRFLQVVEELDRFEARHRRVRGYGAFDPKTLPIPEVVKTLDWIKSLAQGDRSLQPLGDGGG